MADARMISLTYHSTNRHFSRKFVSVSETGEDHFRGSCWSHRKISRWDLVPTHCHKYIRTSEQDCWTVLRIQIRKHEQKSNYSNHFESQHQKCGIYCLL